MITKALERIEAVLDCTGQDADCMECQAYKAVQEVRAHIAALQVTADRFEKMQRMLWAIERTGNLAAATVVSTIITLCEEEHAP
jgi:hypothetical protein